MANGYPGDASPLQALVADISKTPTLDKFHAVADDITELQREAVRVEADLYSMRYGCAVRYAKTLEEQIQRQNLPAFQGYPK